MIKAPRALEMGIVSYVTTPGLEVTKSIEIISNMTKNAPTSVVKILQATRLSLYNDEEGYRFERKAFSELINSPNGKEGMKAFIEKRKDRKSTRLNSCHVAISYAVCCLKEKTKGEGR